MPDEPTPGDCDSSRRNFVMTSLAGGFAAAFCDGDDVIIFQIFPTAAILALAFVSTPNFPADCGWNCFAAFAGILRFR